MKRIPIYPIIQTIPNNDTDFHVVYNIEGGGTVEVVKPEYLTAYFSNFADWYLLKPENDTRTDEEYLRYIWVEYCNMSSQNWGMLFKALFSEYDPLDNYNIYEDNSRTNTHGNKSFTHTPNGGTDTSTTTVTNAAATAPTTENYVATYESGEKAYSKSVSTGSTSTTTNVTLAATYTDSTTHGNDTTSETNHRHGNAGVMTTAEVIRQEAQLRKTELACDIVLAGFVEKYLFYSGVII